MIENPEQEEELCATCQLACPVHTDTRRYAALIAEGKYEEALEVIRSVNPIPSICARICHHPCEQECRRAKVDTPVALRHLKRFVMEATREWRKAHRPTAQRTRREMVAIIGSGPAGLTAGADLAKMGYGITIFERSGTLGGLLGLAIPRYRLPFSVLMEDIEDILSLGVEAKTGVEIGKDITLDELREQYDAVLLATGLTESRGLGVPGIDAAGVYLAIPFLNDVLRGEPPELGEEVVVIGGGNVAMDVARSARRLGQPQVTMVCLESREEMPAWEWEIKEAEEEGIQILTRWGPKEVLLKNGKLGAIELKAVTRVFDEEGRFNPEYDESTTQKIPCDSIILAIGQRPDLKAIEGSSVKLTERGQIEVDHRTLATSIPGVFASGEVVTGPGAAIEAVASGHRAASAIHRYLETRRVEPLEEEEEAKGLPELPEEVVEKVPKQEPSPIRHRPPEQRIKGFEEFEEGFTEEEAIREANRCMNCGVGAVLKDRERCAACLTCVRICPFGVATIEQTVAEMPSEMCQACGLCAAECPASAIRIKRFEEKEIPDLVSEHLASLESRPEIIIVSFTCRYEATTRKLLLPDAKLGSEGIIRIPLACTTRLNAVDILKTFEEGVDGVQVMTCPAGACKYPNAELRLESRIHRTRRILDEIGFGGDRLDLYTSKGNPIEEWYRVPRSFLERVKELGPVSAGVA